MGNLIVNIISILGNMSNIQIRETFFVIFIGADYNRWLSDYKVPWFFIFVRGQKGRDGWWGSCKGIERSKRRGYENRISANMGEGRCPHSGHFVITNKLPVIYLEFRGRSKVAEKQVSWFLHNSKRFSQTKLRSYKFCFILSN